MELRRLAIVAGVVASALFLLVGAHERLQMYGDGSIFSYSIAVTDTWSFHWHNIAERLTVFLLTMWPAELWTALTGHPREGIALYGFLFFAIQPLGLLATYLLDRSRGRVVFVFACASNALFCPLVFGFPTEMWVAHALFWPTLACAHFARANRVGAVLTAVLMAALVLTHEGGLVLSIAIVAGLLPRGLTDARATRAALALILALCAFLFIKIEYPPDAYFGEVLIRAGTHFFDRDVFFSPVMCLIYAALAGYGLAVAGLRTWLPSWAPQLAAAFVAAALVLFWIFADRALHAENRYYSRTLLLVGTFVLGAVANVLVLRAEGVQSVILGWLGHWPERISWYADVLAGAFLVVALIHCVETVKFVRSWRSYEGAVQALALGSSSDAELGDRRFVSSARIGAELNRMSWFSTTPYLSSILADFRPRRLVIDPTGNYFWLSCRTATENALAARAVPPDGRDLVRVYSCLHRY